MTKTKKQHYVPRGYLKAWCASEKKLIHVYDTATDSERINNIEDVASERYFYDVTLDEMLSNKAIERLHKEGFTWDSNQKHQFIEHALAQEIESSFSDLLQELIRKSSTVTPWHINNCLFINDSKKAEFSWYLAIQMIRTKRIRDGLLDTSDCLSQVLGDMGVPSDLIEQYCISPEQAKTIHTHMILDAEHLSEITALFSNLTWMLGINKTNLLFYTTDCPICTFGHIKHPYFSMNGIASRGVEVFFPLSPNSILLMLDGSFHSQWRLYEKHYVEITNTQNVDFYNSLLALKANRQVFSNDGNFKLLQDMKRDNPDLFKSPNVKMSWGEQDYYPRRI